MKRHMISTFGLLFLVATHAPAEAQQLAFPGAEGFGRHALGGRGGAVHHVTTLNDSGTGSLRACVQASGPRTCVFRVGGTIVLRSQLSLGGPYLTIAGQTAPGDGIALRADRALSGNLVRINRNDVIVRHVRLRRGAAKGDGDSINVLNANNVILDHVSASWGVDENIGISNPASNITIQWSIISEGLRRANHSKGIHSMGTLLYSSGNGFSVHHNLFAHNNERNPRINVNGYVDVVNNYIYNSGSIPTVITSDFGEVGVNYVGNTYVRGLNSPSSTYAVAGSPTLHGISVYEHDNTLPNGATNAVREQALIRSSPFPVPAVTTQTAVDAARLILERAGALPHDAVDRRLTSEAASGTGRIIDSPTQVGGWPTLANGTPYPDADRDGMDDNWELSRSLDPANPDDRNLDRNGDGYTELEEFLNELAGDVG